MTKSGMVGKNIRISRKDRISIDLDRFNQFELLKVFFNMKRYTSTTIVKQTGHGYHVMGQFLNRTPEMNMHVRRMLGDCKNRLELDEARLRVNEPDLIETLFSRKTMFGKTTYEEDFNIMSEPFWNVRNHL